jgi:predicted RNA-binding protein (virulence factor B family)|tara:strand:+ start:223 stop:447 length:225 start_codon:yes stop_codon:yes gene_type:complete
MKNLNITELEKTVLEIISYGDDYEETPTECFDNIMDSFNGNKNQLKGIIGSLIKKDLIFESEYPNGLTSYHFNN